MDPAVAHVPWSSPALWQEANASLAAALSRHAAAMAGLYHQARRIACALESLFPLMEDLCRDTCPNCADICCRRAWVWADFRDLLFLHLAGIPPPDTQLIGVTDGHCRFAGPHGCQLERIRRPFVCTWYVCPAQIRLLRRRPTAQRRVDAALERIKRLRREMEAAFIRTVA